jgi:hypothetical protein
MENILVEQYLDDIQQEGFIKGIGSEFKDIIDDLKSLPDLIAVGQSPQSAVFKTKTVLGKLDKFLSKLELNFDKIDSHGLLKFRQAFARWRFYFLMNDKVYKKMLSETLKTGKDASGYIDINFKDRIIPEMYNAKSSKDLIKLNDKYIKRIDEIYRLVKKHPENAGLRGLLRQGLYGARDWLVAVRKFASYAS